MAAGLSSRAVVSKTFRSIRASQLLPKPLLPASLFLPPITRQNYDLFQGVRSKKGISVCFVLEETKQTVHVQDHAEEVSEEVKDQILTPRAAQRLARKRSERLTYLVAAVMSSFGITSMAVMSVYYRFHWQMEGGEVPLSEMFGTFALSVGAAVGFNSFPFSILDWLLFFLSLR